MKKIVHNFFKCTKCAKRHFQKHKKTYFNSILWGFGMFALIKSALLVIGLFWGFSFMYPTIYAQSPSNVSATDVTIEWIPSIWSTLKGSYTFDAWEKTRLSLGDKLSLENIEWFAFGNDGVPYVFYNTKSGSSVWKLADGRRSQVGPEFTSWTIRHIILDGNNVPYILHNDDNKNQNVFKFTNWIREQVGNIFINDNILMYWAFDNNNVPYIIYYDEKDRSSIVVKLTNWVWEQVGNNIYMKSQNMLIFDNNNIMLIFDNNNIPYVKCPHNVIKLANWVWEELGDKDIFSGN